VGASVKKIFLLIIIAVSMFFIFRWRYSGLEIKKLCDSANGMHAAEIAKTVENMGLRFGSESPSESVNVIVHSPKNMGRSTCFLTLRNGIVVDAKFSEMD
jgi:hypothetical protein